MNKDNRGFANIIIILIVLALAGAGAYIVSVKQVSTPTLDETASTTTLVITTEDQKNPTNPKTTPETAPPLGQRFDTAVHDVKYFFDTVQVPKDGEVRSGYKNEVTIRGRLVVIKSAALCAELPCPQPGPSDFGYELENAQDYIQNYKYRISFRQTGDPIAMSLKEGGVYVVSGTLEHSFMNDDKVVFFFDPKSVSSTVSTGNNKCDVNPDQNGQCPVGCKNYGVPLGCVPEDYDCEKEGNCQICLASDTSIDTPAGPILVKDLQIGTPVWTTNKIGQRVSGTITKTSKVPVSPTHQMVHLILDDGRELFVSPGHLTIDGKTVGNLVYGDPYDNAHVLSTERVSYGESATYDILPSGDTGFYWANDILIDSTLH